MMPRELAYECDKLARYVIANLSESPKQQALILRKLGKLFAELHPDFTDDELIYLRDEARGWLAHKANGQEP